ncbi:hypothetical protein PR048_027462 [Dryococelus australis]|uniref:Uncharacterized protein n=1 Tax=Dryococelus australis TaxID=614101 RepID=A0ABQ9GFS7_9NEOP|nr:hypothetical protein PR048_027462 [Dryococelus australis]
MPSLMTASCHAPVRDCVQIIHPKRSVKSYVPMRAKRGECRAAPECEGGVNGKYPRKPAGQRQRPTQFPHGKIRGGGGDPTGNRTRFGLVGGEWCGRCTTATPPPSLLIYPRTPTDQRHRPPRLPGIEPISPWWEASVLTAQPPCHRAPNTQPHQHHCHHTLGAQPVSICCWLKSSLWRITHRFFGQRQKSRRACSILEFSLQPHSNSIHTRHLHTPNLPIAIIPNVCHSRIQFNSPVRQPHSSLYRSSQSADSLPLVALLARRFVVFAHIIHKDVRSSKLQTVDSGVRHGLSSIAGLNYNVSSTPSFAERCKGDDQNVHSTITPQIQSHSMTKVLDFDKFITAALLCLSGPCDSRIACTDSSLTSNPIFVVFDGAVRRKAVLGTHSGFCSPRMRTLPHFSSLRFKLPRGNLRFPYSSQGARRSAPRRRPLRSEKSPFNFFFVFSIDKSGVSFHNCGRSFGFMLHTQIYRSGVIRLRWELCCEPLDSKRFSMLKICVATERLIRSEKFWREYVAERPSSRCEGAIRVTVTRAPNASSLLRARRALKHTTVKTRATKLYHKVVESGREWSRTSYDVIPLSAHNDVRSSDLYELHLTLTKKTTSLKNGPKKKCAPAILSKTSNGATVANSTAKKVRHNVLAVQPQKSLKRSSRVSLLAEGELPVLTEEVLCVLEMPNNNITARDAHKFLSVIDQHPEIDISDNAWSTMSYHPYHEIIGDVTRSPGSYDEIDSDFTWATNTYYKNTRRLSQAATTSFESSDYALKLRITDDKPVLPMTTDEIKSGLIEMDVSGDDDDDDDNDNDDDVIMISNNSKIVRFQDKATNSFSKRESSNDQAITNTSNVTIACSSSMNTSSESTNNDKDISNLSRISTNNEATRECPQKVELDDEIFVDYSKVSKIYNITASSISHFAMDSDMTFGDLSKIAVPKTEPTTETNNTTNDNFFCGFSRVVVTQGEINSESPPTMMSSNKTFDDVSRISGICNESSSYLTESTTAIRSNSDFRMTTINHGTTNNSSNAAITSDNTISNLPNITVSQHEKMEELKILKPEKPSGPRANPLPDNRQMLHFSCHCISSPLHFRVQFHVTPRDEGHQWASSRWPVTRRWSTLTAYDDLLEGHESHRMHARLHDRFMQPTADTLGGGKGISPRKPVDQRNRLTRFPRAKTRGVTWPGIEPGSSWEEAGGLAAQSPWPLL